MHEQQPGIPVNQHELQSQGEAALYDAVAALEGRIPELQGRPEVRAAGAQLVKEFDIRPTLFEDEGRSIVFMGIASKWAESTAKETADERDKVFVTDCLSLLAYDHSDQLADAKKIVQGEAESSHNVRVYDKYTDPRLSKSLEQKIDEGLLDDAKKRLGITKETEDPYKIRVLSIGSSRQVMGLDAPRFDYGSVDYRNPDDMKRQSDHIQLQQDIKRWKEGLQQRSKDFVHELGMTEFADAWVTHLDGVPNLCISSALAEKLIDPSVMDNTPSYDERQRRNELAVLEHEYTHTQGGLNVDHEVAFGINVEELRAELFAENKLGYQDIKGFFRDYRLATGQDIPSMLSRQEKGGSVGEIYGEIANRVGLSRMVEVLLASPNNYIDKQSNPIAAEAHEYIGGFDGVLQNILEDEIAKGNTEEIEERIEGAAKVLVDVVEKSDYMTIKGHEKFRGRYGLHVMTEIIAIRAQAIHAERERERYDSATH